METKTLKREFKHCVEEYQDNVKDVFDLELDNILAAEAVKSIFVESLKKINDTNSINQFKKIDLTILFNENYDEKDKTDSVDSKKHFERGKKITESIIIAMAVVKSNTTTLELMKHNSICKVEYEEDVKTLLPDPIELSTKFKKINQEEEKRAREKAAKERREREERATSHDTCAPARNPLLI